MTASETTFQVFALGLAHYHNAPQPFFIVEPDNQLVYTNRAGEQFVERLYGHPPKLGAPVDDLLGKDPSERFEEYLEQACQGNGAEVEKQYDDLPADQRHFRLSFQPIETDEDEVIGVSVALENIGRRVEAEMKFEQIESIFLHHFECSPLPMKVIRQDGVIEKCNTAFRDLLGYDSVEQLEGQKIWETIHEDDLDKSHEAVKDLLEGDAPYARAELREVRADGESSWTDHIAWRLPEVAGGEGKKVLAIAVDINRQKLAEQRVQRSVRMQALGELAGGVAHDFNNVLSIVSTVGHLLHAKLEERGEDELLDYLERIEGAVKSGTSLTRQLMTFGRGGETEGAAADLNATIREVSKLLERTIGENVETRVELAEELPPVRTDGGRLQQVVTNLAVNARDAIGEEGCLEIETERVVFGPDDGSMPAPEMEEGEYALLRVSDDGIGMDEKTLERIFDPFFTTKASNQGTGLGLATVYKIVDDADGHIEVDSQLDVGTTFELYFPQADRQRTSLEENERNEDVSQPTETDASPPEPSTDRRVLLLEDEADLRAPYRIHLERDGYDVLEAGSIEEAKECLEGDGQPDVLVADVVLPDGSGVDFARTLRQRIPDIPVVFISGYAPDLFANQQEEFDGAWEFLAKPVDSDELIEAVSDVLTARDQS